VNLRPEPLQFLTAAPRVLRFTTELHAARPEVFAALTADPATWTWFPGFRGGHYEGAPPYGVGSLRHIQVRGIGRLRETIMAWDEPSVWTYRVDSTTVPIARALIEEWALDDSGRGTRARWTFAVDPTPMFGVALTVAPFSLRRTFEQAMRALERRLLSG
jgi:hypothetical protein